MWNTILCCNKVRVVNKIVYCVTQNAFAHKLYFLLFNLFNKGDDDDCGEFNDLE